MHFTSILLAGGGAFVAYFITGGLIFGLFPVMRNEFAKYTTVYRPQDEIRKVMPAGMLAMLVAILALAALYARLDVHRGVRSGAIFGALVGIYSVGSFVIHNHVNLQIGIRLTVQQAIAYFVEWVIVGIVIGAIYR